MDLQVRLPWVVAAPAGTGKIRVEGWALVSGGAVNVTWKDGTTATTGPMTMASGTPNVVPFTPEGWFDVSAGNALNLNLSAAVQVSGIVRYVVSRSRPGRLRKSLRKFLS
jgi:hypothetical protein